jgi:uncharacterized protein (TIGR00369 family)
MTESTTTPQPVPDGFILLKLTSNPFIQVNGPLYGRWHNQQFTLGLRIESRHCNPGGMCHGGMLMTFADMTMLLGANLQADVRQYLLTVNLSTDFIAPAPMGAWIEGQMQVLRAGRSVVFAQGLLSIGAAPIARISGVFKPTGDPRPGSTAERLFSQDNPLERLF